ncbi:Cellobiose dehydrogenase, cytochrome [Niveomyces insectorum RCEF 264]|uniref:Cellobiose dehydrogenase, cytochrome n=1 Tax=Niveomyces insectorum RCEF 264 TaxID=1081102 RepID=A0A167YKR3_9HYPO|nr:Cellobiose dehydrogenase, cytochrome [Niveomyces insectorum RCEF 264]
MRLWNLASACVATLLGAGFASAAGTTAYHDPQTGFTFAECTLQYQIGRSLVFRVAVPKNVQSLTSYDAVLQVVAPSSAGWVGFAWGGRMIGDPLTVAWSSGSSVVVSSRRASDHVGTPQPYSGATYTMLKSGTHINGTHWQYTVMCSGCTYYSNSAQGKSWIFPTGVNHVAFAYAAARPSNPSSASSGFSIHDVTNNWDHDFSVGQNDAFADLVAKNS